MKSKIKNFYLATFTTQFNVFVITESWLNDSVVDNDIAAKDFTIFRLDRNPKNSQFVNGGGLLIGVISSANPKLLDVPEDIEIMCIENNS